MNILSFVLFVLLVSAFYSLLAVWRRLSAERLTSLSQLGELRESHGRLSAIAEHAERRALTLDRELRQLAIERTQLTGQLEGERARGEEKVQAYAQAHSVMVDQFKRIAGDVLDEKKKAFSEGSKAELASLLSPLGATLDAFKKRVEDVHTADSQQRAALSQEIKTTFVMTQSFQKGAEELTRALRGSIKVQGNWGERVLESVLEASGLRRGHEYHTQLSREREDGTRGQPDVVVNLPGERHLVVDSKVSLTAFYEHQNGESELERNLALKRHIDSLHAHIKGLSAKSYQNLYGIRTLDFVLLFIPIEPAFMLAATADPSIFQTALDKNIILVSPRTLLFVLRTVASLWRQEQQSQNAQDIARHGANLYDKLVGFVAELDKVGSSLNAAQSSFSDARQKLASGRGNVIARAEKLKQLGVKPTKALPPQLFDADTDSSTAQRAASSSSS